jgi:CubicO group peptidase (beta-lactamase class C family)
MSTLSTLLDHAVADGTTPAAQVVVLHDGQVRHSSAHGHVAPFGTATSAHTRFDLASVTKVAATTAAAAVLVQRGLLDLDAPIGRVLPAVAWRDRTARELLGHRGGLVPWQPWFDAARKDPRCAPLWTGGAGDRALARKLTLAAAWQTPAGPRGVRAYSDLGFLALGELISALVGEPLDGFVLREVFHRAGTGLRYRRVGADAPDPTIATTGACRPRPPAPGQQGAFDPDPHTTSTLGGEVDDDNAWAVGGVAGHAGLFGTATDLATLGEVIRRDLDGASTLARADVWRELVAVDAPDVTPVRSLGFDRPSAVGSSVGDRFGRGPRGAIGHLGFTGCSLWIDLDHALVVALVTNRTALGRENVAGIRALRPAVHTAATSLTQR